MTKTLINGEAVEKISIRDRGLQYGDGLFETMAVRNGRIHLWPAHWQRLSLGCEKLLISLPSKALLEKEIALLCKDGKDGNETQFVIKLIITRGEGARGYRFSANQTTTRILSRYPWPDYPLYYQTDGVSVCYCEMTLSENKTLAGIKHLNRLEQVLARNEWANDNNEFQEGLMLSLQGHVVDGTMSNIFIVKEGEIFTPDLSLAGVAGVMRSTVMNIAQESGYTVHVATLTKTDIRQADEIFLSNSLIGIWPVSNIAEINFAQVGEVTKQLQQQIEKIYLS
jgi:4-amino-4-deoxychorismate lyase